MTQAPRRWMRPPGLPAVLERTVMRALEKSTTARFQSAAEMAAARCSSLRRWRRGGGRGGARAGGRWAGSSRPGWERPR
ncbi:MAG: hypothetical protein R3F43_17715 [bacterium]